MEATIAFYRDTLGLRLIASFSDPVELAFFDLNGTRLMLEAGESTGSVLYFHVEDLEGTVSKLKSSGVEVIGDVHAIHRDNDGTFGPAGETEFMAFLKDPSDNVVGLVERRLDNSNA